MAEQVLAASCPVGHSGGKVVAGKPGVRQTCCGPSPSERKLHELFCFVFSSNQYVRGAGVGLLLTDKIHISPSLVKTCKRTTGSQNDMKGNSAQNGNIRAELLADVGHALRNNPRAAHAFAALMWLVGDAARVSPKCEALIAPLVNDGISLAYEHTSDHQADHEAGLERFRRVLADEFGTSGW